MPGVYGDFEAGSDGWYGSGSTVAQRVNDSGAAYGGDWYWHVETPGVASEEGTVQYDGVEVDAGTPYRIDCPINRHNANPLQIVAVYLDAGLNYLGQSSSGERNPAEDTWVVEAHTFTTPANCAWIRTYVVGWGAVALDFDIDSVSLSLTTPVTGTAAPATGIAGASAAGTPIARGSVSTSLTAVSGGGVGTSTVAGSANGTAGSVAGGGAGSPIVGGAAAGAAVVPAGSASGTSAVTGAAPPVTAIPAGTGIGTVRVYGAAAANAPATTGEAWDGAAHGFGASGTVAVAPTLTATVTIAAAHGGTVRIS